MKGGFLRVCQGGGLCLSALKMGISSHLCVWGLQCHSCARMLWHSFLLAGTPLLLAPPVLGRGSMGTFPGSGSMQMEEAGLHCSIFTLTLSLVAARAYYLKTAAVFAVALTRCPTECLEEDVEQNSFLSLE